MSETPDYTFTFSDNIKLDKECCTFRVVDGLKLEVRESIYEKIKDEPYIQENFKLNVRRLNRWWYSIYFEKK
jgi:hypothetical protein